MNVANLDLCRELYELSGWNTGPQLHDPWGQVVQGRSFGGEIPAYDLGYLLRKLPAKSSIYKGLNYWTARYKDARCRVHRSAEDAAAKLAIELFKQGILTK